LHACAARRPRAGPAFRRGVPATESDQRSILVADVAEPATSRADECGGGISGDGPPHPAGRAEAAGPAQADPGLGRSERRARAIACAHTRRQEAPGPRHADLARPSWRAGEGAGPPARRIEERADPAFEGGLAPSIRGAA